MTDVVLKYRPTTEEVLRKLNVEIKGGEKIGVVGRTGAGKSTITLALTRIIELTSGKIEVDGVEIGKISLQQVREPSQSFLKSQLCSRDLLDSTCTQKS